MLVLDKQRAIERIVALADAHAHAPAAPVPLRTRTPARIAAYAPLPQAAGAEERAPSRRGVRRRRAAFSI